MLLKKDTTADKEISKLSTFLINEFSNEFPKNNIEYKESAIEMTIRLLNRLKWMEESLENIGYRIVQKT